jgi:hypothetical protein
VVTVSGFDFVPSQSIIGIDLLGILNGGRYENNGRVEVSAIQINGVGLQTQLIKRTPGYVPLYNAWVLWNAFLIDTACPANVDVVITPQLVGAYTQITINNLRLNATFNAGDRLSLKFPTSFEFPTPTQISQ